MIRQAEMENDPVMVAIEALAFIAGDWARLAQVLFPPHGGLLKALQAA